MWRSFFLCKKVRSEGRKMKNLLILGAGGHGHVVAETARSMTDAEGKPLYDKISFLDDLKPEAIGKLSEMPLFKKEYQEVFPAFGSYEQRLEMYTKAKRFGFTIPVLIHPEAYVSPSATIGEGTVILPKAVVHTGADIGKVCILSIGSLTDHDCVLEDGVHLDCGAIIKGSRIPEGERIPCGMTIENQKGMRKG